MAEEKVATLENQVRRLLGDYPTTIGKGMLAGIVKGKLLILADPEANPADDDHLSSTGKSWVRNVTKPTQAPVGDFNVMVTITQSVPEEDRERTLNYRTEHPKTKKKKAS